MSRCLYCTTRWWRSMNRMWRPLAVCLTAHQCLSPVDKDSAARPLASPCRPPFARATIARLATTLRNSHKGDRILSLIRLQARWLTALLDVGLEVVTRSVASILLVQKFVQGNVLGFDTLRVRSVFEEHTSRVSMIPSQVIDALDLAISSMASGHVHSRKFLSLKLLTWTLMLKRTQHFNVVWIATQATLPTSHLSSLVLREVMTHS